MSDERVQRFPEWRRTVPVGVRFRTPDGADAVVASIDVWSDRTALHFAFDASGNSPGGLRPSGPPELPQRLGMLFTVEDDVGSEYRYFGYGGGGTNDFQHGIQFFRPPIPEEARRLLISGPELTEPIEVSLP
jgi:hypothetical protein